ncbi:hypothetical protein Trydic_g6737, partial [Trypoxylus dichotomus]
DRSNLELRLIRDSLRNFTDFLFKTASIHIFFHRI